jgi:hypothetical protein
MSTYKINLKEQTATSINGITFKLTETNEEYEGVCLNPKSIYTQAILLSIINYG